jgi:hypothetical protein
MKIGFKAVIKHKVVKYEPERGLYGLLECEIEFRRD